MKTIDFKIRPHYSEKNRKKMLQFISSIYEV